MPLASALWPISGFSVVVIPVSFLGGLRALSRVVAEDQVGDAAGLVLPLHVVGEPVDGLGARSARSVDLLDVGDLDAHADPAAHPERSREPDLVEAVVEDDAEALDRADLPQQPGGQAEGEEAVLHGGAERPGLRPLGVDVDPLLVAGEGRERGDVLLRDGPPAADADLGADPLTEPLETLDHHGRAGGCLLDNRFTHRRRPSSWPVVGAGSCRPPSPAASETPATEAGRALPRVSC